MNFGESMQKLFIGSVAVVLLCGVSGCERKERIVDVQTPIGDVKVDQNKATGDVDVEVKREPRPITP